MNGGRLAFLEASLVYLGRYQMWSHLVDLLQYRLLHDLRQVRAYDDGSDLVQGNWALGVCLLQRNESPYPQVVRYVAAVESLSYLSHDFCTQLLICREQVPIKAVGSQSLVEVGAFGGRLNVTHTESCSRVDLLLTHLSVATASSHMLWPLVNGLKVLSDCSLDMLSFFEDFCVATQSFTLHLGDHWVAPLDPHVLVGDIIEVLHLAVSQQLAKLLDASGIVDFASNCQFLLLLLHLILCTVSDRYMPSTHLLLLLPLKLLHFLCHHIVMDVLVCWFVDCSTCVEQALCCRLHAHELPQVALW